MVRQADIDEANKPENKNLTKGIKWERSCTDVLCCLIYLVFNASIIVIAAWGFTQGNPYNIITPFDYQGNVCGQNNQNITLNSTKQLGLDMTNFKYKFLNFSPSAVANIQTSPLTFYQAVCVSSCPLTGQQALCANPPAGGSCPYSVFDTSTQFIPTYCLPTVATVTNITMYVIAQAESQSQVAVYMLALQNSWQPMAIMCAGSFFIALFYIFILKWITKPLLYMSLLIILIALCAFGAFVFMYQYTPNLSANSQQWAYGSGIGIWCFAGAYLICICCCWKNISLGASIMEAASEFVSHNVRILFLPVFSYLASAIFFILWVFTAAFIYSMGTATFNQFSPIPTMTFNQETQGIMWYFVFCLLWVVAYIICLQQFMIACMACMWYFSGAGTDMADAPGEVSLFKAIGWGMWYHCGSIAFGSFLIALITFIRIVFEYIVYQYEKMGQKDNCLYKTVTCCIRCILYCLDKYVKFITKNAYIQIALHSENFCTSAWNSFWLIIRNAGRFGSAEMIGWIMMILGKGVIVAASSFITYLITLYKWPQCAQPMVPAVIIGIVSYLIGSLFLSIFSFSCTSILHCFLLDEDTGGSQLTPNSLKGFLDYTDKQNAKEAQSPAKQADEKTGNKVE